MRGVLCEQQRTDMPQPSTRQRLRTICGATDRVRSVIKLEARDVPVLGIFTDVTAIAGYTTGRGVVSSRHDVDGIVDVVAGRRIVQKIELPAAATVGTEVVAVCCEDVEVGGRRRAESCDTQ